MEKYFVDYWAEEININGDNAEFKLCFSSKTMPFMLHHFFGGKCLIPAAVLSEAMLAACRLIANKEASFWPVAIDKLDIFYGLQVDAEDSLTVLIKAKAFREHGYTTILAEVFGDRKNESGQVVRKNIRLARGELSIGKENDPKIDLDLGKTEYSSFKINPDKYYSLFSCTHKYLFQTFTGSFKISTDKKRCISEFEVEDKENDFSGISGLNFYLSPLGIDSILQTAVFQSVLSDPGESEFVLSKIPVGLEGLRMKENFKRNRRYYCHLALISNSEQDMELSGYVGDFSGFIIGTVERIKLKKAPFLKFERGAPIKILEKYREIE